jgi:hypothetical protein
MRVTCPQGHGPKLARQTGSRPAIWAAINPAVKPVETSRGPDQNGCVQRTCGGELLSDAGRHRPPLVPDLTPRGENHVSDKP